MQAITYWVIRYVPDAARAEYQNIGIVCGSDSGDWNAAFDWRHLNLRTPPDVREWAEWFASQIRERNMLQQSHEFTKGWIQGIRQRQSNSIQLADAMPVTAESAHAAVGLLFERLVRHEHKERARRTTRRTLRAEMRTIYGFTALREGLDYFDRPEVRMGQLHTDIDFIQLNEQIPVVRNVWAFDVAGLDDLERDIQAWNYGITRLRDDGASMRRSDGWIDLSSDSIITAVIDPPVHESPRRADIYSAALESWEREKVDVLTLEQFDERLAFSLTS